MTVILTKGQWAFVEKYLLCRGPMPVPAPTPGADYQQLVIETNAILARLNLFNADATKIQQLLAEARAEHAKGTEDGDKAAYDKALRAAQLAVNDITFLQKNQSEFKKLADEIAVPTGALPAERLDLDARIAAVRALVAADPMSEADYGRAFSQYADFVDALEIVKQAIQDRVQARSDLGSAHRAALQEIVLIKTQIGRCKAGPALTAITKDLPALEADIAHLKAAVDADDPALIAADTANVGGIKTRLGAMSTALGAILDGALRPLVAKTGTTDAQKDKLLSLGRADPASMAAAVTALEGFERKLNGAPVAQADLDARARATAAAKNELDAKHAALRAAWADANLLSGAVGAVRQQMERQQLTAQEAHRAALEYYNAHRAELEAPGNPGYPAAVKDYTRLYEAAEDAKAKAGEARAYYEEKKKERLDPVRDAQQKLNAAEAAYDEAVEKETCANGKKKLLDAISFGPLAPGNGRPVPGATATDLIALYSKNPGLADKAVAAASTAPNPDSVVRCAQIVTDRFDTRFKDRHGNKVPRDKDILPYAERLIGMSAHIPLAETAKLDAYLDDGRHFADVPGVLRRSSDEKTGKVRADHVGAAAFKADGTLDLAAGRVAMEDLMFHPKALKGASTAQVVHMLETFDFLEATPEAQALLNTTTAPADPGARGLLARATGKAAAEIDEKDTRNAVFTAMMTPLYQGKVGSCFATGGVIRMRQEKPLDVMKGLAKLAVDGTFHPEEGDEVAAVQTVPKNENALLRSFEYTVATAAARVTDSREREVLDEKLARAIEDLAPKFKEKQRESAVQRLKTAMSAAFDFVYDAGTKAAGVTDGSSTHGGYKLVRTSDGEVVTDADGFAKTLKEVFLKEVAKRDTGRKLTAKKVDQWMADPKFKTELEKKKNAPWKLRSGGLPDQTARVLDGGDKFISDIAPYEKSENLDMEQRSKVVLGSLLDTAGDGGGGLTSVGTHGHRNHAFTFDGDHPSLAPFKGADPAETQANIQRELIAKGKETAAKVLPLDQVTYMFDREMAALLKEATGTGKAALEAARTAHRPTAGMTPGDFAAHMKTAMDAWADALAKEKADAEQARRTGKGKAMTQAEYDEYKKTQKEKRFERSVEEPITDRMIDDLGLPEVVLGDTNWGDPASHEHFVLSVDPKTGLPQLYKRLDPPGTLRKLKNAADWMASAWDVTKDRPAGATP
ncbi:MAG: hypothetical protein AAGG09_09265 [Pseudomonadota bacterium]